MNQPLGSTSRGEILVVDDNPTNLALLTNMLTDDGYEVRAALSGQLALRAALASAPDLVLLDINMPGMNGYDVCRELKAAESTRDIPIVYISALDAIGDKVMAFQSGGADYITKPFQMREVLARVHTQLTLVRQRKELQEMRRDLDDRHRQIRDLHGALRGHLAERAYEAAGAEGPGSARATRRTLTILSTEIRGFSRIADETPPDRLLADLDFYMAGLTGIIGDHVGEVERIHADTLVAFFTDAGRAVRCACHIQKHLAGFNAAREAARAAAFGTRIGLATGPALLARRGSPTRREVTLVGDCAGLASRLQSDARPGGVLLDNPTFDAAGRPEDTRHMVMRVRGKTELIKAHEILPDAAIRMHDVHGAPGSGPAPGQGD